MQDGGKRAIYAPNSLQRLVCSRKRAIVFISVVVCVIVAIAAIAAFAHPSSPQFGCRAITAGPNGSDVNKSTAEPFLSTTGKPFPWTSIRLPEIIEPVSYELFVHPNLSTFQFDGNVSMSFSVSRSTDFLLFHVKTLQINSFELNELSSDGRTGDRVEVAEALECVRLELFHLQLTSKIVPRKMYQLKVDYSGKLTDSLTGFYRSSYETRSGEKR